MEYNASNKTPIPPGGGDKPKQPTTESTTEAEEWGDRVETGRDIARGGKAVGTVPGATGDEPADPRSGNADDDGE